MNTQAIIPWTPTFGGGDALSAILSFVKPARRMVRLTIMSALRQQTTPENIVNGDFSGGTTGWTLDAGWSIGSGKATCTNTGSLNDLSNSAALVEGVSYNTSFDYVGGSGNVRIILGTGATQGTQRNSVGTWTQTLVAGSGTPPLFTLRASAGATPQVDNVSCIEVGASGYHPGIQLAAYRGRTANGPWENSPYIGPFLITNSQYLASAINGAVAVGATSIVVDDGSLFRVGRPIIIAPGTHQQQTRTILGISTNTLTLDDRIYTAVSDDAAVVQVQPWSIDLNPHGAPYLKIVLTNLDAGASPDSLVAAFASELLGREIL